MNGDEPAPLFITADNIAAILTKRFASGDPGSGLTLTAHEAHMLVACFQHRAAAPSAPPPHRCSGCNRRWDALPGVELCGDCWRKVQPKLEWAENTTGRADAPSAPTPALEEVIDRMTAAIDTPHSEDGCASRWEVEQWRRMIQEAGAGSSPRTEQP